MRLRNVLKSRTRILTAALALLAAVAGFALMQVPAGGPALTNYLADGALLVLEAKDFSGLLGEWSRSEEKRLWLASDNYRAFETSKLFLRLGEAQQEFGAAAGLPAQMPLVESVAGGESALAVYDIGELRFVYITRMAQARAVENALWRSRANFEPRRVGGREYYVRADDANGRVVAFAATDDLLLLATDPERLADALRLIAGESVTAIPQGEWYRDAVAAAEGRGELRMVLDMPALTRTPHFRSYWIQQNVTALSAYRAGVIDLHRAAGELREKRVFLRQAGGGEAAASGELARLLPVEATLQRWWAAVTPDEAAAALKQKLLAPQTQGESYSGEAPEVGSSSLSVGHEGMMETKIDVEPPAYTPGVFEPAGLIEVFRGVGVTGLAVGQRTHGGDSVDLASSGAVVVVEGGQDWDVNAAAAAIRGAAQDLFAVSGIGAEWSGGTPYLEVDGLTRLQVAARGRFLFVANDAELMASALGRVSQPAGAAATAYGVRFEHLAERERSLQLLRHLDFVRTGGFSDDENRSPAFFSENAGSLSETLGRVRTVTLERREESGRVLEEVAYLLN